jgi:3-oxoadipate enol-lactonase
MGELTERAEENFGSAKMNVIERGKGPALVLVPGIQGRWQYHAPAIAALSRHFRVITFSLSGERGSDHVFDGALGLDNYVDQIDRALAAARLDRAIICGVSFGGVPAVRYAASRRARCQALVLVSTPRPGLRLRREHEIYLSMPRLFGPFFLVTTPWRLREEVWRALPRPRERIQHGVRLVRTFLTAPPSLALMAARAQLLVNGNLSDECARIAVPTLVITGEPGLDYVVPVEGSSEYVRLIRGARAATLERTGHIGSNTRPDVFAELIRRFIDEVGHAAA